MKLLYNNIIIKRIKYKNVVLRSYEIIDKCTNKNRNIVECHNEARGM